MPEKYLSYFHHYFLCLYQRKFRDIPIELFPKSFHLPDGLGEADLALRDKRDAVKYYKKALEVNSEIVRFLM